MNPRFYIRPKDYFCSTFCFGKSLGFLHKFSSKKGRGEWNEHLQFVLYVLVFLFLNVKWQIWNLYLSKQELTHWKRLWRWEGLGAGGEGDDRGWDSWMASPTRWTWVWVNSGSWWWTGRPCVLQFMGSQRVGHNLATKLNWSITSLLFKMVITLPLFHMRIKGDNIC